MGNLESWRRTGRRNNGIEKDSCPKGRKMDVWNAKHRQIRLPDMQHMNRNNPRVQEGRINMQDQTKDWELSEEYYKEETGTKELRLEDFMETEEPTNAPAGLMQGSSLSEQLEAMAELVKQAKELSGAGHRAEQIAAMLNMEEQQVKDVLICIQSFPEDDPLAVARLILLG